MIRCIDLLKIITMKIAVAEEYLIRYLSKVVDEGQDEAPMEDETGIVPDEFEGIGVINYNGMITEWGSDMFTDMMRKMNKDPNIKAVVLSMDTPGGDYFSSIRMKSEVSSMNKPVVVHTALLASGGVMASLPADHIMAADEMSEIGSIGVVFTYSPMMVEIMKDFEKMIFSKDSPRKMEEYRALLEGDESLMQKKVDRSGELFIKAVSQFRELKGDKKTTLSGAMFPARSAKRRGLVDSIGNFTEALKVAQRLSQ